MKYDLTYKFYAKSFKKAKIAHKIITASNENAARLLFISWCLENSIFAVVIKVERSNEE